MTWSWGKKGAHCCGHVLWRKGLLFSVMFFVLLPLFLSAQSPNILFSSDENFSIGLIQPSDDNLVQYSVSTYSISSLLPPCSLPAETNVDALGRLSLNEIIISLDEDAVINGTLYADEDLIRFDGATFSLWWDGSAAGLPPEVNLDAVHIERAAPKKFLFSLEEDAVLPGVGLVADEDVLEFEEGVGFSTVLDGSAIGIPVEADVNGVAKAGANYVLSLDSAAWIAGTLYDDADLIEYNGFTFSKFFDAAANGIAPEVDINAVEILGPTEVPDWIKF
jgi:hypothetical protein